MFERRCASADARLAVREGVRVFSEMHATIHDKGQMVIPTQARKEAGLQTGDVVSVHSEGDGKLILIRQRAAKRPQSVKATVTHRKGKHPVGDIGRPITREEIKAALHDFP